MKQVLTLSIIIFFQHLLFAQIDSETILGAWRNYSRGIKSDWKILLACPVKTFYFTSDQVGVILNEGAGNSTTVQKGIWEITKDSIKIIIHESLSYDNNVGGLTSYRTGLSVEKNYHHSLFSIFHPALTPLLPKPIPENTYNIKLDALDYYLTKQRETVNFKFSFDFNEIWIKDCRKRLGPWANPCRFP